MDTAHPLLVSMGANRLPSDRRALGNGSASAEERSTEQPSSKTQLRGISSGSRAVQTPPATHRVTLVVYGWHNAQPGTLSWTFPNARQALVAARALRNAERWAILAGETKDIEAAKKRGELLFEQ